MVRYLLTAPKCTDLGRTGTPDLGIGAELDPLDRLKRGKTVNSGPPPARAGLNSAKFKSLWPEHSGVQGPDPAKPGLRDRPREAEWGLVTIRNESAVVEIGWVDRVSHPLDPWHRFPRSQLFDPFWAPKRIEKRRRLTAPAVRASQGPQPEGSIWQGHSEPRPPFRKETKSGVLRRSKLIFQVPICEGPGQARRPSLARSRPRDGSDENCKRGATN